MLNNIIASVDYVVLKVVILWKSNPSKCVCDSIKGRGRLNLRMQIIHISNVGFCAIGIGMWFYFVNRNSKLLVKSLDCAHGDIDNTHLVNTQIMFV